MNLGTNIATTPGQETYTMLRLRRRFSLFLGLSLGLLWIGACQPVKRVGDISGTTLAQVQRDTSVSDEQINAITSSLTANQTKSIIIASDGAPYGINASHDGFYSTSIGSGGVVTGLKSMLKYAPVTWVTRAKGGSEANFLDGQGLVEVSKTGLTSRNTVVDQGYPDDFHPLKIAYVHPTVSEVDGYYENIANPFLWFVQHGIPLAGVPEQDKWDNGYKAVNQKFADAVADLALRDDTANYVILHDYQLYLLPGLLKQKLQATGCDCVKTLHFTHIPWPKADSWLYQASRSFPNGNNSSSWFIEMFESMLATDVLGFQTVDDALNFVATVKAFLGADKVVSSPNAGQGIRIYYKNHLTLVDAYPISIDPDYIIGKYNEARARKDLPDNPNDEDLATYKQKIAAIEYYRSTVNKLILRTERLDPAKGVYAGMKAYQALLEKKRNNGTLYAGNETDGQYSVGMISILIPTRENIPEYAAYKDAVINLVNQINQEYAEHPDYTEGDAKFYDVGQPWRPILYYNYNDWLYALYLMGLSDVLMATSRADGMNLVVKEAATISQYAANPEHNIMGLPTTLLISDGLGVTREFLNAGMESIYPVSAPPDYKNDIPGFDRWVNKTANDLETTLRYSHNESYADVQDAAVFIRTNDTKKWLFRQLQALQQVRR
ncbi:MAG: trehalose-6-phosphate synthase [Myxococcales bacterium]|nr:MAG: trehalose-6-phosphate synthase [Myxococcales bacterium]